MTWRHFLLLLFALAYLRLDMARPARHTAESEDLLCLNWLSWNLAQRTSESRPVFCRRISLLHRSPRRQDHRRGVAETWMARWPVKLDSNSTGPNPYQFKAKAEPQPAFAWYFPPNAHNTV
jgi:hypothetical protein